MGVVNKKKTNEFCHVTGYDGTNAFVCYKIRINCEFCAHTTHTHTHSHYHRFKCIKNDINDNYVLLQTPANNKFMCLKLKTHLIIIIIIIDAYFQTRKPKHNAHTGTDTFLHTFKC